jgi:hypothetical protein
MSSDIEACVQWARSRLTCRQLSLFDALIQTLAPTVTDEDAVWRLIDQCMVWVICSRTRNKRKRRPVTL